MEDGERTYRRSLPISLGMKIETFSLDRRITVRKAGAPNPDGECVLLDAAGIAWGIVGKHDRPWFVRPVFEQLRYMSLASTGRKFNSKSYIAQMQPGAGTCQGTGSRL
jgi:hypothetical protein